mgnify:CR=1 FL=1
MLSCYTIYSTYDKVEINMTKNLYKINTFEQLTQEIKNMLKVINDDYNNEEYEIVRTYGEREAYKSAVHTVLGMMNYYNKNKTD